MAWREYVDPGTGEGWYTDDRGNFTQNSDEYTSQEYLRSQSDAAQMDYDLRRWETEANLGLGYARIAADNARSAAELDQAWRIFQTQWNTLSAKDREQYAWLRESFYADLDEKRYQFDAGLYSDLAKSLLSTASQLRGPANIFPYLEYTAGGKDVFSGLFGDQATPAFGAPTGSSRPVSITDLLKDLGIGQLPQRGEKPKDTDTTTATGLTHEQALDWIWQTRLDLAGFYGKNGWQADSVEARRAIVMDWINNGDPNWKGKTAQEVATALGYKAPETPEASRQPKENPASNPILAGTQAAATGSPGQAPPNDDLGNGIVNRSASPGQPPPRTPDYGPYGDSQRPPVQSINIGAGVGVKGGGTPVGQPAERTPWGGPYQSSPIAKPANISQAVWDALGPTAQSLFADKGYLVPNPHQVHPAVWDSYNDSQKQAVLSAAEGGYSPSGAWLGNDYLRQMRNARPKGQAPKQVSYDWGKQKSSFF